MQRKRNIELRAHVLSLHKLNSEWKSSNIADFIQNLQYKLTQSRHVFLQFISRTIKEIHKMIVVDLGGRQSNHQNLSKL